MTNPTTDTLLQWLARLSPQERRRESAIALENLNRIYKNHPYALNKKRELCRTE